MKTKQYFNFFLFLSSLYSQSTQQSEVLPTVYNFDYEDERRALRDELDKYRKENELLRQLLNSHKIHGDGRDKVTTSIVGQSVQATTTSFDSGLDKTTSGLSSTGLSSNELQVELNESKERERRLKEQVNSLRKVRKRKENYFII